VAERIERFYGGGSGIEIMSKLGEGTVVTLRIAGAGVDVKSD
jgi:two-component system sensor histidine kinase LytS